MNARADRRRAGPFLARASIIAAMAVGSVSLWIANPIGWLWIGSQLQRDSRLTVGPYLVVIVGILVTAAASAVGLAALNRLYERVTGAPPEVRVILPWHRSMRDERHGGRGEPGRPVSVLDIVMVVSVLLCVASFLAWYLITDPTPPNIGGPGPSKD